MGIADSEKGCKEGGECDREGKVEREGEEGEEGWEGREGCNADVGNVGGGSREDREERAGAEELEEEVEGGEAGEYDSEDGHRDVTRAIGKETGHRRPSPDKDREKGEEWGSAALVEDYIVAPMPSFIQSQPGVPAWQVDGEQGLKNSIRR